MTEQTKEPEVSKDEFDFAEIRKRNAEKGEKLKRERLQANDSVKRSYQLIPKKRK